MSTVFHMMVPVAVTNVLGIKGINGQRINPPANRGFGLGDCWHHTLPPTAHKARRMNRGGISG